MSNTAQQPTNTAKPRLMDEVWARIRVKHYGYSPDDTATDWADKIRARKG